MTKQSGALSIDELKGILNEASKEFSHLSEHARFLDAKSSKRIGGMMRGFIKASDAAATNSPLLVHCLAHAVLGRVGWGVLRGLLILCQPSP
jgi:hypothetical protein